MITPRPSATRLAQAIARAELRLAGDERGYVVTQRVLTRLHQQLGKLVGTVGFDVLLRRALVLAQRVRPPLAGITAGPGGKLEGLAERAGSVASFDDDAVAIVSHFIELLVTLIGEDLAMRMIRDSWPAERDEAKR